MSIRETIAAVAEAGAGRAPVLNPGRYPLTYAYDFVRRHAAELGMQEGAARMENDQLGWVVRSWSHRHGESVEDVLVALADGYLTEHGYADEPDRRAEALRQARKNQWASLGYTTAPVLSTTTATTGS